MPNHHPVNAPFPLLLRQVSTRRPDPEQSDSYNAQEMPSFRVIHYPGTFHHVRSVVIHRAASAAAMTSRDNVSALLAAITHPALVLAPKSSSSNESGWQRCPRCTAHPSHRRIAIFITLLQSRPSHVAGDNRRLTPKKSMATLARAATSNLHETVKVTRRYTMSILAGLTISTKKFQHVLPIHDVCQLRGALLSRHVQALLSAECQQNANGIMTCGASTQIHSALASGERVRRLLAVPLDIFRHRRRGKIMAQSLYASHESDPSESKAVGV
ncbi:hypothetical protein C8Q80DRAFT_198153 [Daedaleopsis nitida]|nr:hypothetical protein C8Q80DRAFT_198153 [Daedaleopsis nitida]